MADVHPLSPKIKARLDDETSSLDDDTLIRTPKGAILACEHNARLLIAHAPQYAELHFDDFLSRMRIGERDWADGDELGAVCWLQSTHGVARFTLQHARAARESSPIPGAGTPCASSSKGYPVGWNGTHRVRLPDAWGARDDALTRAASQTFSWR